MTTPTDDPDRAVADYLRGLYLSRRNLHMGTVDPEAEPVSRLHPQFDGGTSAYGTTHVSVWPKLARFVRANGLDPYALVTSLFHLQSLFDHTPPRPTDLRDPRVVARSRNMHRELRLDRACAARTERLNIRREAYMRVLHNGQEPAAALRAALLDDRLDASPLVRYLVAVKAGEGEIAAHLLTAAVPQYAFDREVYDDVFGGVPQPLAEAAEAYRGDYRVS